MFKLIPERPEFAAYVGRLNERPALMRATEKDRKLQAEQEARAWAALRRLSYLETRGENLNDINDPSIEFRPFR